MSFAVTICVAPPEGAPLLDALQVEGVASILGRTLDRAVYAVDETGARVTVIDRWLGCHPEGATIMLVLTSTAPASAQAAATALVRHMLKAHAALSGWRITESLVERRQATRPEPESEPARSGPRQHSKPCSRSGMVGHGRKP